MASPTLLLDALFSLLTGSLYAYIGYITSRRKVGGDGQIALDLFSVWWYGLGALTLLAVPIRILAYLERLDLDLMVTFTHLTLLFLCVALWGLLYYLVYLFTGSRRWLAPISVLYTLVYVWVVYLVVDAHPDGVLVTGWNVVLRYAEPFPPVISTIAGLLIVAPVFLAAIGYSTLFFRVKEATQRYRIGTIAFTIAAWFGSSLVAIALGIDQYPAWIVTSRLIALASSVLIYSAYRPPAWARHRWGVRPMDEPPE